MNVTLLCVGDVVGAPGRRAVASLLPEIVRAHHVDCIIANVENAAAGSGLTPPLYEKFVRAGVHLMTMGDHIYRRKDIIKVLETSDRIVRPANLSPAAPGREYAVWETPQGVRVGVMSVLGRLFMKPPVDCPFRAVDRVLGVLQREADVVVVDVHAETTSEKVAMGWHLDGRVGVVYGTHTHIPTADERVLPQGTAYITDLGMTGPYDSVLGRRKDRVLSALITQLPTPFDVATEDTSLCGVVVELSPETGRARSIERIRVPAPVPDGTQP